MDELTEPMALIVAIGAPVRSEVLPPREVPLVRSFEWMSTHLDLIW